MPPMLALVPAVTLTVSLSRLRLATVLSAEVTPAFWPMQSPPHGNLLKFWTSSGVSSPAWSNPARTMVEISPKSVSTPAASVTFSAKVTMPCLVAVPVRGIAMKPLPGEEIE